MIAALASAFFVVAGAASIAVIVTSLRRALAVAADLRAALEDLTWAS
ncbi:hypothetical protein QQS45_00145 [Alteriqipengyuania flavescens]|nr:hypothetical protein [Alteriqipengyuania flavescens]WJY18700.1 hypothetical protein QQW98_00145 [Alteriqipengyuania flavescens]WJY24640.1 hypothetical protein QQS45_00145 [Alteriqipengyuania flavescens]